MVRFNMSLLLTILLLFFIVTGTIAANDKAGNGNSGNGKNGNSGNDKNGNSGNGKNGNSGNDKNGNSGNDKNGNSGKDKNDNSGNDKHEPKPKPPKKVKCSQDKKINPHCGGSEDVCPARCPDSCILDCKACKPVCVCDKPGACGDPKFIGGDGNIFYFHGSKNRDFCILSDSDLHINAHFIGKRGSSMTRDFTWIQAIAVLFGQHRLYVGAKKTASWDDEMDHLDISFNDEHVHLPEGTGAEWKSLHVPALTISRTKSANGVIVELKGRFKIIANAVPITEKDSRIHKYGLSKDDCLAHLDIAFNFETLTSDVHGVVGQTYRPDYVNKFDVSVKMPVMGGASSFFSSNIFSTDCAISRFGRVEKTVEMISDLANIKCSSGMDGPGVVCKK